MEKGFGLLRDQIRMKFKTGEIKQKNVSYQTLSRMLCESADMTLCRIIWVAELLIIKDEGESNTIRQNLTALDKTSQPWFGERIIIEIQEYYSLRTEKQKEDCLFRKDSPPFCGPFVYCPMNASTLSLGI